MPLRAQLPSLIGRLMFRLIWMTVLIALLVTGSSWFLLQRHFDELSDYRLIEAADILSVAVATLHNVSNHSEFVLPDDEQEEKYVWQLVDMQQGRVHSRSEQAPPQPLATRPSHAPFDSMDDEWRIVTHPVGKDGRHFFLVAQKRKHTLNAIGSLIASNLLLVLILTLSFSASVLYMVKRDLRPLTRLSDEASSYDLSNSVPAPLESGWVELAPMAQSINTMGQQLSRRVLSERAFNLHASHALRTPLAALKMQIQVARHVPDAEIRPWIDKASQTVDRLIRIVTSLLSMFRSGAGARLEATSVQDLIKLWADDAVTLELTGLDEVECDSDLVSGVLLNLLDNSKKHGASAVRLTSVRYPNGWFSLFIRDNGGGCPGKKLSELRKNLELHHFDQEQGLHGLGLMLADVVMTAHGGRVNLPQVNSGFCVELTWPGTAHA